MCSIIFDDVVAQFGDVVVPSFFVVVRDINIIRTHKTFEFRPARLPWSRIKFAMIANF